MRKTKEVLRLRFELGLGQRQIARSCGVGLGTVHDYLERAAAAGIGWPLPEGWSEEELEAKLFGSQLVQARAVRLRPARRHAPEDRPFLNPCRLQPPVNRLLHRFSPTAARPPIASCFPSP